MVENNRSQSRVFVPALGIMGWHKLAPGDVVEILSKAQFNQQVKLLLSTASCQSQHGHLLKVERIITVDGEQYLVLQIPPDPTFEEDFREYGYGLLKVSSQGQLTAITPDEAATVNSSLDDLTCEQDDLVEVASATLGDVADWDEDVLKMTCNHVSGDE